MCARPLIMHQGLKRRVALWSSSQDTVGRASTGGCPVAHVAGSRSGFRVRRRLQLSDPADIPVPSHTIERAFLGFQVAIEKSVAVDTRASSGGPAGSMASVGAWLMPINVRKNFGAGAASKLARPAA